MRSGRGPRTRTAGCSRRSPTTGTRKGMAGMPCTAWLSWSGKTAMAYATRWLLALSLVAPVPTVPVQAQGPAPAFTPKDEQIEDLPDGPGRDETFGMCTACHGYKLVSNQGLTRDRWDETLTWMTERHGMPNVQGA